MKGVARAGDVSASPSSSTEYPLGTPTATGSWSAGDVQETTVTLARSDGAAVVRQASCTFTFSGTLKSNGNPFTGPPSVVTLSPSPRVLKVGGNHPLVDGDEAQDEYGNKVRVSSSATWRTD